MPNAELLLQSHGHAETTRGEASSAAGVARRRPRVLVVDDDAIDRMLARAKLHVLGYDAVAVGSGEAALDALAAESFDLAFMDCRMPGLDGYETTRLLRRHEARGEMAHEGRLPVIAATCGPGYRDRCEAAGMNGFLVKPYSRDELKVILYRWLTADV